MKLNKLLLIISIVLISLGGATFIAGAVLALLGNGLGDLFMGLSGIFGFAAIGVLIFRLFRMAKEPGLYEEPRPKVVVKIVDVKVSCAHGCRELKSNNNPNKKGNESNQDREGSGGYRAVQPGY